ncbi:MAG: 30S ribosomal protein S16 [Bacteroidia bacterium]|nr:30S ribosomal protein S16 [Bacteroidia bacterium]
MPVKLRLKRQGRRKLPHYAIVAADSRSPRDGRFIEKIGFYDAISQPAKIYVDHAKALKWLQNGAQPTNTVGDILRHAGVTVKFALLKQGKSEEEASRIFSRWWDQKKSKKKKRMVSVDISGMPLEEVPVTEKPKPVVVEAPKVEETPVVEETSVVEEVPAAEVEETATTEEQSE